MRVIYLILAFALSACADEVTQNQSLPTSLNSGDSKAITSNPLKNIYFGDTHIHTVLSFDAFLFGTRRTPEDAYNYAKGELIEHARGFPMQLGKPLDFLVVSDHAYYLGILRELADPNGSHPDNPLAPYFQGEPSAEDSTNAFTGVFEYLQGDAEQISLLSDRQITRSAWQEIIDAAERHNDPGKFTTFIGYEYTSGSVFSGPAPDNLHRNVIFKGSSVPDAPYSRLSSTNPEDLWSWMDLNRARGFDSLAIPHNMNRSNGRMFEKTNYAGAPIDSAWAELRMRNEPIVENSQVKGTSDTHPLLSPNDEWADFGILPSARGAEPQGSYVRQALLDGLVMEEELGFNPYQVGVIASSDTHNGAGSFDEDNYWSKTGFLDTPAYRRGSVPLPEPAADGSVYANGASKYWGASGLAGVWAESNTRDAIFEAMRNRETFSTSGPHIKLRFFAGSDLDGGVLESANGVEHAYSNGVPMGSELVLNGDKAPSFYIWATQDPDTYPLQRLQIIKGWVVAGTGHEVVIDVACSDGLSVNKDTSRCPDNEARVNVSDCSVTGGKGASELSVVWTDPDFDSKQRAFYYVRVLQNPSCRWSTYDAIRAGVPPRPDMQATIQERAWSSPIWYSP